MDLPLNHLGTRIEGFGNSLQSWLESDTVKIYHLDSIKPYLV